MPGRRCTDRPGDAQRSTKEAFVFGRMVLQIGEIRLLRALDEVENANHLNLPAIFPIIIGLITIEDFGRGAFPVLFFGACSLILDPASASISDGKMGF